MESRVNRRTVAKGAGAIAGTAAMRSGQPAAAKAASQETGSTPTAESLFDRVGGFFALAAVVNRFSDEIIKNPKLNENPALKEWNEKEAETRLPGLKFMRTMWMAAAAGGPVEYTGLPLDEAHQDLHLTPEEFEEVGAEIVRALDFYKVPEREQQELVAAYMTSMDDVVSPSD
jgi:hemoglobin